MRLRLLPLAAGLLAAACHAAEPPGEWIRMFDGKTLDGWKAAERPESWSVKNGAIAGDGDVSHLFWMKRECVNCEFKAMVRINHGGNSGMYFRAAFGPGWPKGYEAQVNNTHPDPRRTGSLYAMADIKEQLIPDDTWWEQHIIADGNRIVIRIDGRTVVDHVDANNTYTRGYLALQQHHPGSVVEYKDLMFRALPSGFDAARLVDLTHPYDERTIYWPTAQPFRYRKEHWGKGPGGYFYASGRYSASEHGGTHLDAPVHFAEGKATVDRIPVADLFLPAVVIDVSARALRNPDYEVQPDDIAAWEQAHGRIPARSAVLVHTGWGRYWPDPKRYLGTEKPGDVAGLRFPGIGAEAARVFAARGVRAVGIDTASIDYGRSKDFMTHRVLYAADIYGLENIANLERLPPSGATLIALPMKIAGGSGAPARVVALLP